MKSLFSTTQEDRIFKNSVKLTVPLSKILKSDRILVLDQGHLVEEGAHKTLLKEKGLYAALAEKQLLT